MGPTDIDREALLTSIDGEIDIKRCDCDVLLCVVSCVLYGGYVPGGTYANTHHMLRGNANTMNKTMDTDGPMNIIG